MKSILLVALSMFGFAFIAQKSDSWKVYLNKTLLLNATEENETKNVLQVKRRSLSKQGEFEIKYQEVIPNNDWIRTFAIFDGDTSILQIVSPRDFKISNAKLRKLVSGKSKVKLYTWSLPKNPALASTIRIRRIHLCTLELQ
jgi:hypothetical protein